MAAIVENITRPLAEEGRLEWSAADLWPAGEIVLTLKFSSADLASEVYRTLHDELQMVNFRIGSLNIRQEG